MQKKGLWDAKGRHFVIALEEESHGKTRHTQEDMVINANYI
jgi:hypothetical protein